MRGEGRQSRVVCRSGGQVSCRGHLGARLSASVRVVSQGAPPPRRAAGAAAAGLRLGGLALGSGLGLGGRLLGCLGLGSGLGLGGSLLDLWEREGGGRVGRCQPVKGGWGVSKRRKSSSLRRLACSAAAECVNSPHPAAAPNSGALLPACAPWGWPWPSALPPPSFRRRPPWASWRQAWWCSSWRPAS